MYQEGVGNTMIIDDDMDMNGSEAGDIGVTLVQLH